MTTNNPATAWLAANGSPAALGLPDADTIAQLANALFNALPGRPTVPGLAADVQAAPPSSALPSAPPLAPEGEFASLALAPYVSPTSGFSPASDAELRATPASLSSVGGAVHPSTAAAPPDESPLYLLDPAQPGLPGTAVGLVPSSATRIESGAMPTAPSPPSGIAQPAEPSLRSIPATAGGAAALAPTTTGSLSETFPFSFRPELVPAPTPPSVGGATPTHSIPSAALPQDASSQLAIDESAIPTTAGPSVEAASPVSAPLSASPATASPFYFLNEATRPYPATGLADFDPFGFPGLVTELELGAFPFDSRLKDAPANPAQEATGLGVH